MRTRVAAARVRLLAARMPTARRISVLIATLLLATRVSATDTIPFTAAGEHVRRLVTIEGVVARAATTPERRCILEFDPNDPAALRVVLIIPLITDLPADPSRLYQGKRVQVTGRVTRFQNRLEMLVTPPQIDVVGLTEPPPPPTPRPTTTLPPPPPPAPAPRAAPTPSAAPNPPAAAPAPPVPATPAPAPARAPAPPAPALPAPTAPPPAPPVSTTQPPPPIVDPRCAGWRAQRSQLREEVRTLTEALNECLAADRPGCAALGDRLGPPLSRLADVEQRLDAACP